MKSLSLPSFHGALRGAVCLAVATLLNGPTAAQQFNFDDFFKPKDKKGAVLFSNVPVSMRSRMTAEFRVSAMRQFGGKPTTEKAIVAALRWLKTHQNEEGSWSNECKPAMTGLALLCFLGHGELPASPEFGSTVKKALDWLQQKGSESDGRMSLTKGEWLRDVSVYEHALGTQSICEYFAMTQDAAFAALIPKAAAITVDGQNPSGGWDLFFHQGVRSDLSVTAWQVQALHAAWLTKLPIPGLDQALDKSVIYIKAKQGNEGGFGYDRAENRVAFTGMGVISAYLTTQSKDRTVKEGIDYLLGKAEVKYKGGKAQADLYAWYFDTQACYRFGGTAWTKWNGMFQDEIADNQSPDGSWPPTQGDAYQTKVDGAGPCYRTALCTLMLEVFYRSTPGPAVR